MRSAPKLSKVTVACIWKELFSTTQIPHRTERQYLPLVRGARMLAATSFSCDEAIRRDMQSIPFRELCRQRS